MLIEIEDVIANALIELKKRVNINYVSIVEAEYYAVAVIEKLRNQGINTRFYTDRYKFDNFKNSYSKYFSVVETRKDVLCFINDGITIEDLEQKFRGCLSVDTLLAFVDDDIVTKSLPSANIQEASPNISKYFKKIKSNKVTVSSFNN